MALAADTDKELAAGEEREKREGGRRNVCVFAVARFVFVLCAR